MTDQAEIAVRNLMTSWSDRDRADVGAYLSDDAVFFNGPRGVYHGAETITALFRRNLSVTSWFDVDIKALVSDGHTVMVERIDKFEIDGKRFGMELVGVFDVADDGRITRWREYYDFRTFQTELEAAGLPSGPRAEVRIEGDRM